MLQDINFRQYALIQDSLIFQDVFKIANIEDFPFNKCKTPALNVSGVWRDIKDPVINCDNSDMIMIISSRAVNYEISLSEIFPNLMGALPLCPRDDGVTTGLAQVTQAADFVREIVKYIPLILRKFLYVPTNIRFADVTCNAATVALSTRDGISLPEDAVKVAKRYGVRLELPSFGRLALNSSEIQFFNSLQSSCWLLFSSDGALCGRDPLQATDMRTGNADVDRALEGFNINKLLSATMLIVYSLIENNRTIMEMDLTNRVFLKWMSIFYSVPEGFCYALGGNDTNIPNIIEQIDYTRLQIFAYSPTMTFDGSLPIYFGESTEDDTGLASWPAEEEIMPEVEPDMGDTAHPFSEASLYGGVMRVTRLSPSQKIQVTDVNGRRALRDVQIVEKVVYVELDLFKEARTIRVADSIEELLKGVSAELLESCKRGDFKSTTILDDFAQLFESADDCTIEYSLFKEVH